jgi:two-component system sensor histidine kinase PilS (NtrC family)
MILRVVVATVMLGVTVLIQLREGVEFFSTPMRGLYLFIGLFYLLTIAYGLLLPQVRDPGRFVGIQLNVDLVLLSGIVLITGGVASPFLIVYFLVIIGSGILLYRRGSFAAAGASAVLYGAAVWAPFTPRVAAFVDPEGSYLALSRAAVGSRLLLAVFGFFVIAFLSSYLAESLRRVGEELTATSATLAELERRSEHILQNIASGLATTDLEGRVTYYNRAAERITQLQAAAVLGRRFTEIFRTRGDSDPWAHPDLLEGAALRVEGGIRGRGEEPLLGMTFSPLHDEREALSGVICAFQDLTRIRQMEEQIRRSDRLAAIGELAAGMAHEIRNPLASLSGSILLLREELQLDATGRELMDIVTREVGRLNGLITDFLQYASPRPLQTRPTSLLEILRETTLLLRQARGGDCRIEVVAREAGEFRAEVDPQLIRQVFWNLSLNALEAMPGGGELTVELSTAGEEARIAFSDTGAGIPPDRMAKIFTPFYSTKEGGTGLGLAIVFKIVEAHGGRVEVESPPSRGATFRVVLPVRRGAAVLAPAALGGAA